MNYEIILSGDGVSSGKHTNQNVVLTIMIKMFNKSLRMGLEESAVQKIPWICLMGCSC